MIRVLITEDSTVVAEILKKILGSDPDIEVVGWARNGVESVELTDRLRPDVVTMDIRMPIMDGLEATKQIMGVCPTSILVISASVNKADTASSFDAISAGALDVIEKPQADSSLRYAEIGEELVRRVKIVSRVRPFRHIQTLPRPVPPIAVTSVRATATGKIMVIGASTGGPQAIREILKSLPAVLPVPVLAVQHISRGFIHGFAEWLNRECSVKTIVARDGDTPLSGVVYFPSDDHHMGLHPNGQLRLTKSLPINGHRPSIDYTMRSAAATHGPGSIGVLLTGMGRDGVEGMSAIKHAGGTTIAQDESTSVVFGMPKEAIAAGVVDKVVALTELAFEITSLFSSLHSVEGDTHK